MYIAYRMIMICYVCYIDVDFKEEMNEYEVGCYDHDLYIICRVTAETTEITMKECLAYEKMESSEREKTHIPSCSVKVFNIIPRKKLFLAPTHISIIERS